MSLNGYRLSDAAMYSYKIQDVYPDMVSFAAAIPDHLKPLFLIPSTGNTCLASKNVLIASRLAQDIQPTGHTDDADLFGARTFVYDDNITTKPSSEPGSIFEINSPDERTHHQEFNYDENITPPSTTGYNTDVDMSDYFAYPYRTNEKVRRSHIITPVIIVKLAVNPKTLERNTPEKIKNNANKVSVKLIEYIPEDRKFEFDARTSGSSTGHKVDMGLLDIDSVALSCDCKFWRFNGPEFLASENKYILGGPYGTATKAEVRDPEKQYWLCKHTYAVIKDFEKYVKDIKSEMPDDATDVQVLKEIESNTDVLEDITEIPLDEVEEELEASEETGPDSDVDAIQVPATDEELQDIVNQADSDVQAALDQLEEDISVDDQNVDQGQDEEVEQSIPDYKREFEEKMDRYEKQEREGYKELVESKTPKKPMTQKEKEQAGIEQFVTDVQDDQAQGQSDQGTGRYDQETPRQATSLRSRVRKSQ